METLDQSAQEALCEAILAEARRESEQAVRRAQDEAAALLSQAAAEADQLRQERLAQARAEASRTAELILATVPVEAGRHRSGEIEALLQTICERARGQLAQRQKLDYRATVVSLAAEAVSRMEGGAFLVKLPAAERRAIGDGLAEQITHRLGRPSLSITISDEPTLPEDGLLVQDPQGRQVWNNGLQARLERLWPELRRQIAVRTSLVPRDSPAGGGL